MPNNYPRTIENGHGEKLTFLGMVETPEGTIIEVDNEVQPGHGPPMHVHFKQLESLTVVKGKMGVQRPGGKPEYFNVGETGTFEAGDAHKFWNAGDDVLVCKGFARPANNLEYFLTALFESTKSSGKGRPGLFDAAYLMKHFKTEFDMFEIPGFAKKVIFPLILFFGKVAGKHKKFADAPEAVK